MKKLYSTGLKSLICLSIFCFTACEVVELETPLNQDGVQSPVGFPTSADALNSTLASNQDQEWKALTFQLEGLSGLQTCRLDDTFTFFANGTYRYDGGEVLCGGEDNTQVKTGTWQADFDNREIVFDITTNLESQASITGIEGNRMELAGSVNVMGTQLSIRGIYEQVN